MSCLIFRLAASGYLARKATLAPSRCGRTSFTLLLFTCWRDHDEVTVKGRVQGHQPCVGCAAFHGLSRVMFVGEGKCNRSTEVDVWSDLSLMRMSAPEVEHESALRGCVDLVSLNVCQHCLCTSVHILCTPANVVTSALAQVFKKQSSTVSNHNIHSTGLIDGTLQTSVGGRWTARLNHVHAVLVCPLTP